MDDKEISDYEKQRLSEMLDFFEVGNACFEDVNKLLGVLKRLVESGNTVIVIEHNLDIIKVADHILDLGPEGGRKGGMITGEGTPEEIIKIKSNETGKYLKPYLMKN